MNKNSPDWHYQATYAYVMRKHASRNKYVPKRGEGQPAWRKRQARGT